MKYIGKLNHPQYGEMDLYEMGPDGINSVEGWRILAAKKNAPRRGNTERHKAKLRYPKYNPNLRFVKRAEVAG